MFSTKSQVWHLSVMSNLTLGTEHYLSVWCQTWLLVLNIISQCDVKHMTLSVPRVRFDITLTDNVQYQESGLTSHWQIMFMIKSHVFDITLSVSVMSNLTLDTEHYLSVWCQTWLLVMNIISQCDVKPDSWYWTLAVSVMSNLTLGTEHYQSVWWMFSTKSQVWHHTDR
jgi:hypothetical protein